MGVVYLRVGWQLQDFCSNECNCMGCRCLQLYQYNDYMHKKALNDRFIVEAARGWSGAQAHDGLGTNAYEKLIHREILSRGHESLDSRILELMNMKNTAQELARNDHRTVCAQAEKILDAPDIKDDFYLNLLDWSSRGTLAIGLAERVYLYSPKQITELCVQEDDNYICSLNFHPQGSQLAVGLFTGKTQIYDVETETLIRSIKGHTQRVSSSAFTYGLLYTGSRDTQILGHDVRAHRNVVMKLEGHRGEVCGLKHDACGLASGSNDNLAMVWDLNMAQNRYMLQGHRGAVKALSWCPWKRNLLVTGGGATDKTMRMWNIETGKTLNVLNAQSQVCSIICHPRHREIITSHGYSQNQLNIWKFDQPDNNCLNCHKFTELRGHTQRVLHMSLSPDCSTICTASADQTLRFWKIFGSTELGHQQKCATKHFDLQSSNLR